MTTPNNSQEQDNILDVLNEAMMAEVVQEDDQDEVSFRGSPDDAINATADSLDDELVDDDVSGSIADPVEEDPSTDDIDMVAATADVDPKSRASRRIENLVAKTKQYEADIESLRGEFGRTLKAERQQFAAAAQQTQEQLRQLAAYTSNLEQRLQTLSEDKEDSGSDAAKFERRIQRNFAPKIQEYLDRAVGPVANKLQQLEQERAHERERRAMDSVLREFEAKAEATAHDVLKDRVGEAGLKTLKSQTADWLLNGAAASRKPPTEFGPDLGKWLDEYYKRRQAHETLKRQTKRTRGRNVPPPGRRAEAGARGTAMPKYSREEIKGARYKDYMEASRDGFRRIKDARAMKG